MEAGSHHSAVITIKHVSTFVNKVENYCSYIRTFDLIDKCRYVFYGYDGSIKLYPGKDDIVRVVKLRLSDRSELKRDTQRICVLSIEDDQV
jgi:hypothetical protein